MVAGLEQPTSGRVLIGDTDLTGRRPYERPVNTVFQSYALFPHLRSATTWRSACGDAAEGRRRAQAEETLKLVELGHLRRRKPAQLSGGQQQRVALARALVNRPEVLLLDEPLGALDLKLRRQIQVELKRIQTEVGLTFIHVTHDQEEAMTMADTVAVMNHGRIEQMGHPAELYDLPRTTFVANFVGRSNLGTGEVVDRDGEHVVAEIQGTRVEVPLARAGATEGSVTFGVRPEKVRVLRQAPEGAGDDVRGIVLDVSFTGVATEYLVRLPSGTVWSCYEQNLDVDPVDLRPGDDVWISWNPAHAFTVPVDEAAARAAAEATA